MRESAERKIGQEASLKKGAPVGVETHLFADDGLIPNNSNLPLVIYRQVFGRKSSACAPEETFTALFKANGWEGSWVNGIYPYHHYHSTAHEVLGVAEAMPMCSSAVHTVSSPRSAPETRSSFRRASDIAA